MRPLATRRLTALAISAVITLGAAGPAAAGEHHPSSAADRAARAPLPEAAALLTQAQALGGLGAVTTPVTELVTAALKADAGQLPAADADALKAKIAAAVEQAKGVAPAPLPETPAPDLPAPDLPAPDLPAPELPAPELPAPDLPAPDLPAPELPAPDLPAPDLPAPDLPVTPPAVETPVGLPVKPPVTLPVTAGAKAADTGRAAPADIVDDALATVEKAVAGLLAAVTSGDAGGVVPQVTATLTSLVNLAVATVLGSGLPAPDLAGLPALPALPVAVPELPVDPPELPVEPPALPVDPPALPVDPPVKPPVDVPELPVKPPLPVR